MNDKFFQDLRGNVSNIMSLDGSHDFAHIERVYNLAMKISKKTGADMDVVKAATLLHDIARPKEKNDKTLCHAEEGAKMAKEILEKTDFPKDKIDKVIHAISVHRFSKQLKAETREAEILQDADRLDALGAICITRIISYGAKKGRPFYDPNIIPKEIYNGDSETSINHFYEKILKIEPETFKTEKAKKIAKKRYAFVEKFLKQFKAEWDGKK